jgi:hypothetical protein
LFVKNQTHEGDTSGVIGPRNLFWRWVQVPGFLSMVAALVTHQPWLFLGGMILFGAGFWMATKVAMRFPKEWRVMSRGREVGMVFLPPLYFLVAFLWLVGDSLEALRARKVGQN